MKKIAILSLALITVFLISCSNDDDNTTPTTLPEKKLKSIVSTTSGNSSFTTSFNYDAAGKWTSGSTFDDNYTISYNSDGKIARYDVEGQPSSFVEFQYVTNSNLLKKILADTYETATSYSNGKYLAFQFFDGSLENELTVTYDSDNRIETITDNDESTRYKYFYDAQNKITRVEEYSAPTPIGPYTLTDYADYTYETHKNPGYTFIKNNIDFGQFVFSPIAIYPFYNRIFSFDDYGFGLYILPEYNIKTIKKYSVSDANNPVFDISMSHTLDGNIVTSTTINTTYNNNTSSETISYTYED